jgi:hypothetical protein
MNLSKRFFGILATLFLGTVLVSCSETEERNPFEEQKKGDFSPKQVVISKIGDNRTIVESWKNIRRDNENRVTGYEYAFEMKGDILQVESRNCTLDYYTDFNKNECIRNRYIVEYTKTDRGITEKYTENVLEDVTINARGYISRIETVTDHFANNSTEAVTTTSERVFTYNGDLCTASTYNDEEYKITYNYKWDGYMLKNLTVLKENKKDGSVEYNTYAYTFDKKAIYPYTGTSLMPFVQSGMPQIYAAMGYLGKCTPYVLLEETQGGYTKFGDMTSNNIKVHNYFNLEGDPTMKMTYTALSNIYNSYSITFSR